MQKAGEILRKSLNPISPENSSSDEQKPSACDWMRKRSDAFNQSVGDLNLADGYNCDVCRNRGLTSVLSRGLGGMLYEQFVPCKCAPIRDSIWRLRASGIEQFVRDCTFKKFNAVEDWQVSAKESAMRFCEEPPGKWFFIGGAVGCGKTHLCTAIARKLLGKMPLQYMTWASESAKIKAAITDETEYARLTDRLKTVAALYIDDFFKPAVDKDGDVAPPTGADIRLAYDILNFRYIRRLTTIISSERYLAELMDIDEAIASRIAERARGFTVTIARDRAKNFRISDKTQP